MLRPYIFFINPFDVVTRTSYRRMLAISTHTYNALNGPDGVPTLFAQYKVTHEHYVLCYNEWKSQRGQQKGKTSSLTDLFSTLNDNVADWENAVLQVYSKKSAEFISLFPQGRKPFRTGSQDDRIQAVGQLGLTIATYPLLTAVKTNVDVFYTSIVNNNAEQKMDKALTDTKSQALETARISACSELYAILGSLMNIYKNKSLDIEKYFRMDMLRRLPQTEFTGRVAPLTTKEIAKRTFKPTSQLGITNTGLASCEVYIGTTAGGPVPPGTIPVVIPAGENRHIVATQLGDLANKYLNVRNLSDAIEAEYEVEVYA